MWMISKSASGSALKAVSVAFVPSKSLFSPNSCFYPLDNPRTYAYTNGVLQKCRGALWNDEASLFTAPPQSTPRQFSMQSVVRGWVGGAESPALPRACAPISNGKWQISDDFSREAERPRPEAEEGRGSRKQTQST